MTSTPAWKQACEASQTRSDARRSHVRPKDVFWDILYFLGILGALYVILVLAWVAT